MLEILHKGSKAAFIDNEGRDHEIPVLSIGRYIAEERFVVKVEGLEHEFKHIVDEIGITEDYSIHCYISPSMGKSFPEHTDPMDVFIYVLEGYKVMMIDGDMFGIEDGSWIKIEANTPHYAMNVEPSIMLSIGIE